MIQWKPDLGTPRPKAVLGTYLYTSMAVLRKALVQAERWSLVPHNAADAVIDPRPRPEEIHPLNGDQARALMELLVETALRPRISWLLLPG